MPTVMMVGTVRFQTPTGRRYARNRFPLFPSRSGETFALKHFAHNKRTKVFDMPREVCPLTEREQK
eukprot:5762624-Amphidinium_carterae.2